MNFARLLILFVMMTLPCSVSMAEKMAIPLPTLVAGSPLIVVGTMDNLKEHTRDGVDYGEGEITIHEVLFGAVESQKKLVLKWKNPTGLACPRNDHAGTRQQKLIWIFDSVDKLTVSAQSEGRLFPEKKTEVLELVKEKKKL